MKIVPVYSDYNGCMTYVVIDEETKKAVIIDAGQPAEVIKAILEKENAECEAVFLTHGHFDHINYLDGIKEITGCDAFIHELDADKLSDPVKNVSFLFSENFSSSTSVNTLADGDKVTVGNLDVTVIHTPGHTEGSVCYLCTDKENTVLFSGDTLFRNSVGRWDFPGGNKRVLFESIKNLCNQVPVDTPIFPGHGESSTIGTELASNVFLRTDW